MNKIRLFFTTNIIWKILSLAIGISFWFIGINIYNPYKSTVVQVPLTIYNESKLSDSGIVLKNKESLYARTLSVKVRGRAIDIDNFKASMVVASINLGLMEHLTLTTRDTPTPTTVTVTVPPNFEVESYPHTVDIVLDNIKEQRQKISVDYGNTEPAAGYRAGDTYVVTPEYVTIRGAQSDITGIKKAEVIVDITGAKKDIATTAPIKIYDYDGYDITSNFTLNVSEVNVTIPIYKQSRIPIVTATPAYKGEPAPGFGVSVVTWEPKYIDIIGSEEEVEKIKNIELEPIDVTGATADVSQTFLAWSYLSTKVFVAANGGTNEITATVSIEEVVTKTVSVDVNKILVLNETPFDFESDTVEFTVRGIKSLMEGYDGSTLIPTMNLAGLEPGEHEVILQGKLPAGISFEGDQTVKIIIHETVDIPENPENQGNDDLINDENR